jgi:methionyl aminopeptidase
MIVRTKEEREGVVESGRRLGVILEEVSKMVAPGVSTETLDARAEELIRDGGDVPAFLGYKSQGARRAYPATLCVSVNDEVVHGIPNEDPKILEEGDIVSLDLGLIHNGFVSDSAITVPVGEVDAQSKKLMDATKGALTAAIAAAKVGNRVGDISHATEKAYEGTGFSVVKVLGGHGVGGAVHEEPWIGNAGKAGTGELLVPGMVLALEPIANLGKGAVTLAPDGWTYRSKDGSRSAHEEHTILIEEGKTTVLTRRPSESF